MPGNKKVRRMSECLKFVTDRQIALGVIIEYFEQKERDGKSLTHDDQQDYLVALAKYNEWERFLQYVVTEE